MTFKIRFLKKLCALFFLFSLIFSCTTKEEKTVEKKIVPPQIIKEYGYVLNDYKVIKDTIKSGESFGIILDRHHVMYPTINKIASTVKETFDVRRVRAGKPYTILARKDSTEKAQVFIYNHDKINATIVAFTDSTVTAHRYKKPIKIVEKEIGGKIFSSLSVTMDSLHINPGLTNTIADDIYAWTLDFYKLQKGDEFKLVYEEKYINDTIFAGFGNINSAVFKHKNQDFYAFRFLADSTKGLVDYYDDEGKILRRQFLKSPIKFGSRISSPYNLKRRIRHYGYRVKPHKGTDFAAKEGTPIMATASGIVTESTQKGGNGKYVKIRHNNTYETQYLHMRRRNVKKGQFVKQGDIIGWVGRTGSTEGRHVCYRFWKNGRQVDPFKQKLPAAIPLKENIKTKYLAFIKIPKTRLDNIKITETKSASSEIIAKN